MDIRISKTLDAMISRVVFDTTRNDVRQSYKDRLALEILREEVSMGYRALASHLRNWELRLLTQRIETLTKSHPRAEELPPETFYMNYREHLLATYGHARNITTAHALLDILRDRRTATSQTAALYGVGAHSVEEAIAELTMPAAEQSAAHVPFADLGDIPDKPAADNSIERFGLDLTQQARDGRIDPVVGREAEIDRIIQILSRRKKNNPILIGEAGVGKSAIVEGLALRIAEGDVPCTIRDKTIYSLDVPSIVAGTKFRGEFEERMQQLLDDLRRRNDTIVFIDEIHTIVGAGATQGSLDTANILKPALARGELQVIGATTLDEFRENIESDAALERRFQKVVIEPPTAAQTLDILHNIAPHYERYHNVRYTEEALRACVMLTERYVPDRNFPDKAIDAMDEAGARMRILAAQEPESIRETERQISEAARERREAMSALTYDKASSARRRELSLKTRLNEQRAQWRRDLQSGPATVGAAEVEQVITTMTGIPAASISNGEAERLRSLSEHLQERVIGQSDAVERVARSLRRSRAGLKEADRPIGVFLFVGPTGVGKTLLAKELSKWLFDGRRGLIRIDMSEYGEKHNVARLIGSPPGYVGYGEGGQLTEAVRRQPYSVVLLDEIEKAHPDVFSTMLQVFDEGHLTDGTGRTVDFRNTVIIMTSNVGSRAATENAHPVGYNTPSKETGAAAAPEAEYRKALERTFAPEFLNRIDDIIYFRTLTIDDVERIVDLQLEGMLSRTRRLGYDVTITPKARQRLAQMGYETRYGARALRRTLLDEVEDPIASLIIDGKLRAGGSVTVDLSDNRSLTLRVA